MKRYIVELYKDSFIGPHQTITDDIEIAMKYETYDLAISDAWKIKELYLSVEFTGTRIVEIEGEG